jgi:hypothetical protein
MRLQACASAEEQVVDEAAVERELESLPQVARFASGVRGERRPVLALRRSNCFGWRNTSRRNRRTIRAC